MNSENREEETPQHVYFLCVSVMDLILYLSVENLPCDSVVNGSRPLFFRCYNSSLCCVVIKILLFNELSSKMKLIIKKVFMIALLSAVLIIFFILLTAVSIT